MTFYSGKIRFANRVNTIVDCKIFPESLFQVSNPSNVHAGIFDVCFDYSLHIIDIIPFHSIVFVIGIYFHKKMSVFRNDIRNSINNYRMNSSRFNHIYSIILISLIFRKNDVKMISCYDKKELFQNCMSGNLKNEFLAIQGRPNDSSFHGRLIFTRNRNYARNPKRCSVYFLENVNWANVRVHCTVHACLSRW